MSLLDTVRSGVALANSLTAALQATVTYEAFSSVTGDGTVSYAAPAAKQALVTKKQKLVRSLSGEMVMSQAQVVFLDPAVVIDVRDRITLPDSLSGPILNMDGFVDPGTGKPILTEVYLG